MIFEVRRRFGASCCFDTFTFESQFCYLTFSSQFQFLKPYFRHQLSTTNLCKGKVSSYTSAVALASGDSQKSLGWAHRIRKATRISKIVKETTNAIWKVLKEVYLKPPQEVAVWKTISKEFEKIFISSTRELRSVKA